METGENFRKWR